MSPTDTGAGRADGGGNVPAVRLRDVSKSFGGRTVLASVSLDIAPGSVVALLGANGAGKSTLIKILSGVHADHGGEILVDGAPAALQSPLAARQLGIQTVHQRIGEGVDLADRLVVLRDGRLTEDQVRPFDWDAALRAMLAQAHGATTARPVREGDQGDVVLSLRGVRLFEGRTPLDLDLRTGEVTGVVGLLGAGKTELARGLFGAEPFTTGTVALDGRPYTPRRPADAIRGGVHLVPEDRHADALVPGWSVAQNISLPFLRSLSRLGLMNTARENALGRATVDALGVVARDEHSTVEELSGGNQQKVVVGRWLAETPRVLILDEPFRGVDIGARRDIGRRARALAAEGAAVLVLSADVDEVLEVADRVVVLAAGEIHLDAYGAEAERDRVIQTISASV
ncbi:ATP-binding cassette domain-containing protein [Streptomyces scabiei]|uniref:ATP-binding cassette domain-containing protein n=1 Tax=Streptomyces scabiei TaxID=1930 RepID=UPI0029A7616D|nr:ATP-binding cassette domain-containing protein [Streptomyces scabiei]MDX2629832.1 ATP-binding cassette domain-containing protein [Streptomyces scabiei]